MEQTKLAVTLLQAILTLNLLTLVETPFKIIALCIAACGRKRGGAGL